MAGGDGGGRRGARRGTRREGRGWRPGVILGRLAGVVSSRNVARSGGEVEVLGHGPVGLHVAGGVAVITLRRPTKMNAINAGMWETVSRMVRSLSRREDVRVLVLRGEGENFSAGSDLTELGESNLARVEEIFHKAEECAAAFEESPLPTIACIRGHALGTGLLMALACDVRFAERNATFGMPVARLGITLSENFVRRVAALTGPARMKELVYTGRLVGAEEAVSLGFVERLAPEGESVLGETLEAARVIRSQSRASLRAVKRWAGSASGRVPAAYAYIDPDDFPEGVSAFLERRPPRFFEAEEKTSEKERRARVVGLPDDRTEET